MKITNIKIQPMRLQSSHTTNENKDIKENLDVKNSIAYKFFEEKDFNKYFLFNTKTNTYELKPKKSESDLITTIQQKLERRNTHAESDFKQAFTPDRDTNKLLNRILKHLNDFYLPLDIIEKALKNKDIAETIRNSDLDPLLDADQIRKELLKK